MNISSDVFLQRNATPNAFSVKQSMAILEKQLKKVVQSYGFKPCVVILGRNLFELKKKNSSTADTHIPEYQGWMNSRQFEGAFLMSKKSLSACKRTYMMNTLTYFL